MVFRKRKSSRPMRKRRVMGRKAPMKRTSIGRSLNASRQDRATIIESQELALVPEGGNFIQHQLNSFARAKQVASCYRFYKCKKIEMEFIPYANVFPSGTAFPELYYQIDRVQGINNGVPLPLPTKNMMLARGVLPVKWTSIVKRSYVPSVLRNENFVQNVVSSNVTAVAAVTSTPVFNKWYATQQYSALPPFASLTQIQPTWDPLNLNYFGAVYYVDQPLAASSAILGTIKIKVHWEFKEPRWEQDTS